MTKDKRTLKDLNLMDKFLFDEAMEDKDNMKTLLDIVLGQDTHLKYPPQTEKEFRNSKENRRIRLDVYAIDEDDVVYDTEPQNRIPKICLREVDYIKDSSIPIYYHLEVLTLTH